jgi:hypothetical protein
VGAGRLAGWVGAALGFRPRWQVGGWVPFWGFLGFLVCGLAKKRNPDSRTNKKKLKDFHNKDSSTTHIRLQAATHGREL